MPGNTGIAGHRDGFFRALKDITEGDAIELQTLAGRETYRVERIWIVIPTMSRCSTRRRRYR